VTRRVLTLPALRRSDVVGIFLDDASVVRLAGARLSEQNDKWLVHRRYLPVESIALILAAGRFEDSSPPPQQAKSGGCCSQRGLSRQHPTTSQELYTASDNSTAAAWPSGLPVVVVCV
jgi:hypothetical protein